uniref:BZIP domain-containing protein n=1 Tax=Heterorhabditis bacteriophora TaxID=37862 RepID=A0A1I7XCK9_HETBA
MGGLERNRRHRIRRGSTSSSDSSDDGYEISLASAEDRSLSRIRYASLVSRKKFRYESNVSVWWLAIASAVVIAPVPFSKTVQDSGSEKDLNLIMYGIDHSEQIEIAKIRPLGLRWRDEAVLARMAHNYTERCLNERQDIELIDVLWRSDIAAEKGTRQLAPAEQYERDLQLLTEKSIHVQLSAEESSRYEDLSKVYFEDFYTPHLLRRNLNEKTLIPRTSTTLLDLNVKRDIATPTDEDLADLLEDVSKEGGHLDQLTCDPGCCLDTALEPLTEPLLNNVSLSQGIVFSAQNVSEMAYIRDQREAAAIAAQTPPPPAALYNGTGIQMHPWLQQADISSSDIFGNNSFAPFEPQNDTTALIVSTGSHYDHAYQATDSNIRTSRIQHCTTSMMQMYNPYCTSRTVSFSNESSSVCSSSSVVSPSHLNEAENLSPRASRYFGKLIPSHKDDDEIKVFFLTHLALGIIFSRTTLLGMSQQPRRRGRQSKDEQLAAANQLPVSAKEIAEMTLSDLQKVLKNENLTEYQKQLIRKIRRRGKNKVAARTCRQRRGDKHQVIKTVWDGILDPVLRRTAEERISTFEKVPAMDQLFKKFRIEAKSTVLWTELKNCLLTVQEPLTELYKKMMEYIPQKDNLGADGVAQWLEVLYLISKVFHSLCYQDIPEYFEDNLKPWVDGFLELMKLNCPSQVTAAGEPTSLDKLKTELCEIFTLYAQRYEEEINSFMQSIIQAVWQLVVQTEQDTRYSSFSMVCAALEFLSIICQKTHYEGYFTGQGVLQTLAQDVCVKNLHLRQEDLELFEDEPIDYMRRDLEGTDVGTRRRGAVDLVRALCRRFEVHLVPILAQIVQSLCGNGDWLKLDVVYCLVTAMASKTETAKSGATSTSQLVDVSDYYVSQVRAHLSSDVNENPILKADALKFVVTFRNQLRVEILVEVAQAIDRLLTSNLPVLHKYAAYALDKLLLVRNPGDATTLLTARVVPVGSLLTNLVTAFDKDTKAQNSPYLIKAILRVVAILDDDTARHGGAIASKLSSLVEAATKNPADPVHTHFLFETMVIRKKCGKKLDKILKTTNLPEGALDAQLMPLIETILSQDIADLIPYALQITGSLEDIYIY